MGLDGLASARRRGALAIVPVFLSVLLVFQSHSAERDREWDFVRHVLFSSEYGADLSVITRWRRSPVYWAHLRSLEHRPIVEAVVAQLNRVLLDTDFEVQVVFEQPSTFDAVITIVPEKWFQEVMEFAECQMPPGVQNGLACMKVDAEDFSYFLASIAVSEEMSIRQIHSTLLEEVFQSLGIGNDHDIFINSINFDDGEVTTSYLELGAIDKKVLYFLYEYLEPGDDEATVKEKFDTYWHTIEVD